MNPMDIDEARETQFQPAASVPAAAVPNDRRFQALGDLHSLPDETLCAILTYLSPHDIGRLSCVSSVMYIFCNEEPLWMALCLKNMDCRLEYKGSWKRTTLHQLDLLTEYEKSPAKQLHFNGFYSLFLYRRLYRCYTTLDGFSFDNGNVDRKKDLSLQEFSNNYDGQKPVLISGLADTWPARNSWTVEQLLQNYGDLAFHLSQRSSRKIIMTFKDYVSYMQIQHDEDPLYVFDDKFREVAPKLLKDYSVPHLFQEDFFDVLDRDERPSFRWLITGPERSGASWHVDPALTSAWNTLLCGRKRWALYPPGKVPLGVTVHVNEDDGDVNIDTPSSLQWWLDFYPLLSNEDKPIECTQLPGETIFVPSGWWHCVLNLETTVAVTQNFVNSKNFEFVCLDMAPGYRHKGLCRAGILALDEGSFEHVKNDSSCEENHMSCSDFMRKEKRMKMHEPPESGNLTNVEFIYDIKFLSRFLDQERDHYNSEWSSSNVIGQRNMRGWLQKLWVKRPELRGLIWKGACLALNAGRWYDCLREICAFNDLPLPTDEEKLPVGTGSNPVYLVAENVIKIFVEGGLEDSLYGLGTELQFYNLLDQVNSPLKDHIPAVLGSGILFLKDGSNQVIPWDGKGVPPLIENFNMVPENHYKVDYPFGIWNRKQFEYDKVRLSSPVSGNPEGCSNVWPYIVLKRCRGKTFADLRDNLSWNDMLNLATFLGEQLHNLHTLPYPSLNGSTLLVSEQRTELRLGSGFLDGTAGKSSFSPELSTYIKTLNKKKEDISSRLTKWGDPIPVTLIDKVGEYLPDDIEKLFNMFEDDKSVAKPLAKPYTWIHSDVMDDNIQMKPCNLTSCLGESTRDPSPVNNGCVNNFNDSTKSNSWRPCHIIDFSDLSLGHPICDLIPVHLDVFRGDSRLLKQFLESYKLRIVGRKSAENSRFVRASYLTMCLCILNDENVLGAIFSLWKELRQAKSWEEVEEKVWGDLNNYTGFDD